MGPPSLAGTAGPWGEAVLLVGGGRTVGDTKELLGEMQDNGCCSELKV